MTHRFGAYYHREVPREDAELTHVGPGTPCGEYFRRFWQPVCFSDDLRDLPLRIEILGEELVAFRDRRGSVGLLELHLPASGHVAGVWADLGLGHSVPLSRLAVRR